MTNKKDDNKKGKGKNYDVGYGKPPREHQFKKGQSGNPAGRPKAPEPPDHPLKNPQFVHAFLDDAQQVLNVSVSGKTVSMTKIEAIVAQLGNKAMQGHVPSARLYLQTHNAVSTGYDESILELREMLYRIDDAKSREIESMSQFDRIGSLISRWKGRKWHRDRGADVPFEYEEPVDEQDWAELYKYANKLYEEDPNPGQWPPAYWDDDDLEPVE
jgi:hypothetical protein